jgi:hypothetical protein
MREMVGIALVAVAIVLAPAGHFWSPVWWAASSVLALGGIFLYASERTGRREFRERQNLNGNAGDAVPNAPGPLNPGGLRRGSSNSDDFNGDIDGD